MPAASRSGAARWGRCRRDRAPRWSRGRRLGLALALLADARLDALVTGESSFDELPAVLAALATQPGDTLCHRIRHVDLPAPAGPGS